MVNGRACAEHLLLRCAAIADARASKRYDRDMRHREARLAITALAVSFVLRAPHASACSCMGPRDGLVGPDRIEDAPINTHIRVEVAEAARASGVVVRVPGTDVAVETTSRTWPSGHLTFVELTPKKPLAASTRYEIAIVDKNKFPSTTVLGTFKTGTTADTTAPKLDAIGTAAAQGNAHAGGGDCSIKGPWVDIGPLTVDDPGRPTAKLAYALWAGDANGNDDTSKPPNAMLLTIGKRSLCDPHGFDLPKTPFGSFAIAAVDEAGNTSAPKRFRVDFRGVP